ncbi:MAG: class I SAM-dependent methyltransferase [Labrys sp. (in: a-proteobacteria)]
MHKHKIPIAKARARIGDAAQFLRSWTRRPLTIGSVTPSGRALSRAMARQVDPRSEGPVIELGPGTGPVTEALIEHGIAEERLILVEYSAEFVHLLRRRFPKATVIQGDAYALEETLADHRGRKAAAVVSSLPLILKPEPQRLSILRQAFDLMAPGAPFIQFTYAVISPLPLRHGEFTWRAGRRIWLNVPPARVWTYRRGAGA